MWGGNNSGAGGSGKAGLNFEVVGGTVQPQKPKENTIWVNTDVEIASWAFSAAEPVEPVEGMVWVLTKSNSPIPFNALKDNDIQIYAVKAAQFVGGVWVDKEIKFYQESEWNGFGLVIDLVNQEWLKSGSGTYGSYSINEGLLEITKNPGNGNQGAGILVGTQNMDLSLYNTLTVRLKMSSEAGSSVNVGIWASVDYYISGISEKVCEPRTSFFDCVIDISAIQSGCICVKLSSGAADKTAQTATIESIILS